MSGSDDKLQQIGDRVGQQKDPANPPLHLWHPEFSGDIDILIDAEGRWSHEGVAIARESLVRLFASILRREDDGQYYLVTPVEKWRIKVEALPLQIVDFDIASPGTTDQQVWVTTNTGRRYLLGQRYPLYTPTNVPQAAGIPAVSLDNGLSALFGRAAWYRLVEACQERAGELGLHSDGVFFSVS